MGGGYTVAFTQGAAWTLCYQLFLAKQLEQSTLNKAKEREVTKLFYMTINCNSIPVTSLHVSASSGFLVSLQ
jgi:hypothetical protein